MVEVIGTKFVDININTKNDDLLIHLVNTSGQHGDNNIYVFDDIPQTAPLQISITLQQKPNSIILQPDGKALTYTFKDGKIMLELDSLDIYKIIQIVK